ncbi:MAG: MFS transporter, partial [Ferruginibacter sp.]
YVPWLRLRIAHLLFWTDGITNISAALCLLFLLPKVSVEQQKQYSRNPVKENKAVSPYKDKAFLWFLGLQVLFAICFFQLFTTIPLYFKEGLHLSEFWIGVTMAFNGVLIAVIEMVLVFKLEGRKPYLVLMCQGTILMAISFLLAESSHCSRTDRCIHLCIADHFCRNDCNAIYEQLLYFT